MTPWTVAHQAPLSMGFPRQEYWSGLPFPTPGLPFPTPYLCLLGLLHWQVDSLSPRLLGTPAFPEVNLTLEPTLANGFPAWNSLLCVPPHSWPSLSHPDQCVPHHSPDHFSLSLCGNRSVSSTAQKAPGGRSLGLT